MVASRGFDLGCAEPVTVDEQGAIAKVPEDLSYQDAVSLCFGGATALHFFRLGKLASGDVVLGVEASTTQREPRKGALAARR